MIVNPKPCSRTLLFCSPTLYLFHQPCFIVLLARLHRVTLFASIVAVWYHCDGSQPRGTSRAPFVCGAAQIDQRPAAERISSLAHPVHTSSSSTTTDRATHSESNMPKTLTRVFPTQPTGCDMEGHFRNRKWADPVTSSASMRWL